MFQVQHEYPGVADKMKPEIAEFAKALVRHVRDNAIRNADMDLRPGVTSPVAKRWRAANVQGIDVVIPDIVDMTIFHLLNAIDQELLPLGLIGANDDIVNLMVEGHGELGGWYSGTDGWVGMHSEERFVDYLNDTSDQDTP